MDGSEVTENSPILAPGAKIRTGWYTILKACAYAPGLAPSNAVKGTYEIHYCKLYLDGSIRCPPTTLGDKVCIGSDSGKLYCVDVDHLAITWTSDLNQYREAGDTTQMSIRSRPGKNGDRIYVGTTTGYVMCLGQDGSLIWSQRPTATEVGPPVYTNGWIYFASNGMMHRLDAATGTGHLSSIALGANAQSCPSIPDRERIWFGSDNGVICCLSSDLTTVTTAIAVGGGPLKSCPFAFRHVYDTYGKLYYGSANGDVRCYDPILFTRKWISPLLGSAVEAPVWYDLSSDKVVCGTNGGKLVSLRGTDGSITGAFEASGALNVSPMVCQGIIYAPCEDGKLYAVNLSNMSTKSIYPLGATPTSPSICSGKTTNLLVIGLSDGNVWMMPVN